MVRHALGILVALTTAASPAAAFQCPVLIKQLNDAIGTMPAGDTRVKEGRRLTGEATKLHDTGRHADSIVTAGKAARALGVTLRLAPLTPVQAEQVRAAEGRLGQ
jgi:hypothetical protein